MSRRSMMTSSIKTAWKESLDARWKKIYDYPGYLHMGTVVLELQTRRATPDCYKDLHFQSHDVELKKAILDRLLYLGKGDISVHLIHYWKLVPSESFPSLLRNDELNRAYGVYDTFPINANEVKILTESASWSEGFSEHLEIYRSFRPSMELFPPVIVNVVLDYLIPVIPKKKEKEEEPKQSNSGKRKISSITSLELGVAGPS